jgi:flagellar assembly protein FliH
VETRQVPDEPAAVPHPPTIHAAFIVNHGQARQTELLDRLAASIELLAGERTRILARAEGELVELASAIARRVVGHELKIDPTLVVDLAVEGIDALGKGERLSVHIGDLGDDAAMEAIGARLAALAPQCQIVRDPMLPRGGCVVKTEYGTVDESLESRLDRVLAALSTVSGEAAKP